MVQIIIISNGIRVANIDYPNNHLVFGIKNPGIIKVFDDSKLIIETPYTEFINWLSIPYLTPEAVIADLDLSYTGGSGADAVTQAQLLSEVNARSAGDLSLLNSLNSEISTRESEVNALQTDLSNEISARQDTDTALSNEISARSNADSTLQTNIDNEASTRANADQAIQDILDQEILDREGADTALQNNIDNEASIRSSADDALQDLIDTLQTDLDTEESTRAAADSAIITDVTALKNNEFKIIYWSQINTATGTITKPTNSTILLSEFPSGMDAVLETIVNGEPSGSSPLTAGGAIVTINSFDTAGNYTLSGIPASSYPLALLYILKIKAVDYHYIDLDYKFDEEITNAATVSYVDTGLALKENTSNKVTTITGNESSTTKFPVVKAILDYFTAGNIRTILGVTTLSGSNTGDETGARIATIGHAASAKTVLIDGDEVTGQDSANSYSLIKTVWSDVWTYINSKIVGIYATINNSTFTGTMSIPTGATAVTQAAGTNNTTIATTAFVAASTSPTVKLFNYYNFS